MKTEEEIREMLERLKAVYSEDYSPIKFLEWVLEE
jgi:hypothetical protein